MPPDNSDIQSIDVGILKAQFLSLEKAIDEDKKISQSNNAKIDLLSNQLIDIKNIINVHILEDKYNDAELRRLISDNAAKIITLETKTTEEIKNIKIVIATKIPTAWFKDIWKVVIAILIVISNLNSFDMLLKSLKLIP